MHLVDEARAHALYEAMGPGSRCRRLGGEHRGRRGLLRRPRALRRQGPRRSARRGLRPRPPRRPASATTPAGHSGPPTGRCLILVTPDAQRTMSTFLGASVQLGPADIDRRLIARGEDPLPRGLSLRPPEAQEAFRVAAARSRTRAGRKVALDTIEPSASRASARPSSTWSSTTSTSSSSTSRDLRALPGHDFDAALPPRAWATARSPRSRAARYGLRAGHGRPVTTWSRAYPLEAVVDTTGAGDTLRLGRALWATRPAGSTCRPAARFGSAWLVHVEDSSPSAQAPQPDEIDRWPSLPRPGARIEPRWHDAALAAKYDRLVELLREMEPRGRGLLGRRGLDLPRRAPRGTRSASAPCW